ncbi:MAG: hypothetical protein JWP88_514 [Flaviaesturariibacter sp.]|nr:hypothetical protein [Flaviaesturariibacter sp.]
MVNALPQPEKMICLYNNNFRYLLSLKLSALRKFIAICLLGIASLPSFAQKKESFKFEKITPAILQQKVYSIDSNAAAVVLGDVGSTEIIGNTKGWFSFVFRRHLRVHILNKTAYDEAKMEIPVYKNGSIEEKLEALKATTYNLENGQVVETKMDKDNVFTEKVTRVQSLKKFTLPSVKEGSIIDIEYRINSDYLNTLQPWSFQGTIPKLWSEYTVSVPQFFDYAFISKGYIPFYISDKKDRADNFSIIEQNGAAAAERFSFNSGVTDYRWVTKDVPAFKPESYISTAKNYVSHMEFQLAAYKEPLKYKNLISSWPETTKELLNDEDFGKKLDNSNNWLNDVMKPLIASGSSIEKAQKIYAYVRDNITCKSPYGLYLSQPLKNILRTKTGSVSEVNLLLTSMLKYADIKAEPIMLSTRSNGLVYTSYPMLSRFNYVITGASIDGQTYYLDASKPHMGFGRLSPECYNGHARTINLEATPIIMSADSLRESKMTSIILINNEKGEWEGNLQQVPGYYESQSVRNKVQEAGKETFFKELAKTAGVDLTVSNPRIDSLNQYDSPVGLYYDFKMNLDKEDILYINPLFGEGYKENPFKSTDRAYPVEMPYTIDENYNITMYVPDGYVVDELPKGMKMKLNEEGDGYFEYLISQSRDVISLRSRVKFSKATFSPDEYETLREFFNQIVKKQKEQIVFKKKK